MWTVVYMLFVAAGVLGVAQVLAAFRRGAASRATVSVRPLRAPAKARRPSAEPIAWDGTPVGPAAVAHAQGTREGVLDRYIAARFSGLLTGAADLRRVDDMIRIARLWFEEERDDLAQELLDLAIARLPENESLRLAQIEFAFLRRQGGRFESCAARFRQVLPQSRNWDEIARLGRKIAPGNALFASHRAIDPCPHYGPWPDLPNWIQASWDFTGEVLAADFHRDLSRRAAGAAEVRAPQRQRIAIGA